MSRIVKKPEERKKEIVAAARQLFLEKEYEKTSMRDIIEYLGIAKGTIYHYYNSKEDLLDDVIQSEVSKLSVKLKSNLKKAPNNAVDRLTSLITSGQISSKHKTTLKKLHKPGNNFMHSRMLAKLVLDLAKIYAEVIKEGCKEGVFKTDCPLESAELLLAGIQFITDEGIYPWAHQDLERRSLKISSLIEAQIKAPTGTFSFMKSQTTKKDIQ